MKAPLLQLHPLSASPITPTRKYTQARFTDDRGGAALEPVIGLPFVLEILGNALRRDDGLRVVSGDDCDAASRIAAGPCAEPGIAQRQPSDREPALHYGPLAFQTLELIRT